jgi:hypothetical protein
VVVILAHLGRPNGVVVPALSLEPLAAAIAEVLAPVPVRFVPQAIGTEAAAIIQVQALHILNKKQTQPLPMLVGFLKGLMPLTLWRVLAQMQVTLWRREGQAQPILWQPVG